MDNNDTYEIGTYWNFKITEKFSYTFEPHYFMRVNDFNSSNGKDHHWEITNTFRYRINEHWLPYFELRWLDRNVEPYHREQTRFVSERSISSDVKIPDAMLAHLIRSTKPKKKPAIAGRFFYD